MPVKKLASVVVVIVDIPFQSGYTEKWLKNMGGKYYFLFKLVSQVLSMAECQNALCDGCNVDHFATRIPI